VTHGAASREGPPCTVAALGDDPTAALVLSQVSAVVLVVLLPVGHDPPGRGRVAGIAVAAAGGVVALAGVAVLLAVVVLVLVAALAILIYVCDNL